MQEICIARKIHTFCILIFKLLQSEGPTCIALVLFAEYHSVAKILWCKPGQELIINLPLFCLVYQCKTNMFQILKVS